jgi:GTP cyclohydrolase II
MTLPSPIDAAAKRTARAIDALRRGWPVRVGSLILAAIETATDHGAKALLISANRAATLKLANQRAAADVALPVLIKAPTDLAGNLDSAMTMTIADPTLDMRYPMKGPFAALALPDAQSALAAMELARLAGILPAYLVLDAAPADTQAVNADDVAAYTNTDTLQIAVRARLPVCASEDGEIIAFRSLADATDHIALVVGKRDESPPVVRLHSECLTGDVLGSLKCDCGPQLHEALHQMADAQWGVLLYLRQEGRGIGLINKLRAYNLQDQGFDTVDANLRLGFAIDARDFSVAAQMLRLLAIAKIILLTNNPLKVSGLEAQGIVVRERLPLQMVANVHNADYLATKRDRTGHTL